ncbi:DMT family transporter [Pseudomonas matsuisoli]|uniref:Multidrug DMT transporter permease n=1 Tax=Pseudomonas matsuisoli TaxID=1515666 RepID=A0A917UTR9_9PSED|nr:DMT family transporter [Pseudomonas matsuisoli]GGJ84652.1 multidrug DMT transporter permease [Pseudomonas matsuisoli]
MRTAKQKIMPPPALLYLILPPLFWAGNFIVGRAMHGVVPPMTLSLWRWVVALLILLPFAIKYLRRDFPHYRAHGWLLVRLSVAGVVAFTSLVYLGLRDTTASNALLLNSFIPVLITVFGALFYGQRLGRGQSVGLAVSCLGVLVIVSHGEWQRLASLSFSQGDMVIFCAMVSFAFYTLWLRNVPSQINRLGLMAAQIVIALAFLIPLKLWELSLGMTADWSINSLAALAYLGIFPSIFAYVLFNMGVAHFGAAKAGLCIHLIPVFGAILAVVFLGESLRLYHLMGISAILIGIRWVLRSPSVPS